MNIGIFENRYKKRGRTVILIKLIRPAKDRGKADHFLKSFLQRFKSGEKLALNKLLKERVTDTPRYLNAL